MICSGVGSWLRDRRRIGLRRRRCRGGVGRVCRDIVCCARSLVCVASAEQAAEVVRLPEARPQGRVPYMLLRNKRQMTQYYTLNKICAIIIVLILKYLITIFYAFCSFANDTTVFASSSDIINVHATVNRELVGVDNWLKANRLSLNISKTSYMIISN